MLRFWQRLGIPKPRFLAERPTVTDSTPSEPHVSSMNVTTVIIAGWAGRDLAAVQHHIDELAELGVAPPKTTPCFYPVGAELLTTASEISCLGTESSGEVEYFIVVDTHGEKWVGVGSDHTDREAETYSVNFSKQACPKPICNALWKFDEVTRHWDRLILRSWIGDSDAGELYQEGEIASLLHPDDMLAAFQKAGGPLAPGTLIFGGTLPVIGKIRPSRTFRIELADPVLKRRLTHNYVVRSLDMQ